MKYCPKCGTELKDDADFCTKCGAPQPSSVQASPEENKSGNSTQEDENLPTNVLNVIGIATIVLGMMAIVPAHGYTLYFEGGTAMLIGSTLGLLGAIACILSYRKSFFCKIGAIVGIAGAVVGLFTLFSFGIHLG